MKRRILLWKPKKIAHILTTFKQLFCFLHKNGYISSLHRINIFHTIYRLNIAWGDLQKRSFMSTTQRDEGASAENKPSGFFGRMFGGNSKRFKAAKMGVQLQMYYNEEVRRS